MDDANEAANAFRYALKEYGDQPMQDDHFLSGVELDEGSKRRHQQHMMSAHHKFMSRHYKKMMHKKR